jgi:uncharacterized heparinase superfamily protein
VTSKFSRYFFTLIHLKPRQIAYQIWYRTKQFLPSCKYSSSKPLQLRRLRFSDYELVLSSDKYRGNNRFCFLHLEHRFIDVVDWNFSGHGKLWNYNLQYFDWLADANGDKKENDALLEDCARAMLTKKLPLEPYPVSLRIINWLLYYSKTGELSEHVVRALAVQIDYLRKHQEYHIDANHLLENKFALLIAGLYTHENANETSAAELLKTLNQQILDDGAHCECTPMYHCIILSRLLIVLSLLKGNKSLLPDACFHQLRTVASRMLGWLRSFCFQDGSYALLNDAAPLVAPSPAVLYKKAESLGINCQPATLLQSGYRKLRNSCMEVLVDVGNIVPSYQPGHAHADMLSFCLNVDGIPLFIDPGVSTYTANSQRQLERSTLFHNTVTIRYENQSDVWSAFRVGKRARLKIVTDRPNQLCAEHDGYRERFGVVHRRSFRLREDALSIRDTLVGKKAISATACFYLNPGTTVRRIDGGFIINDCLLVVFGNNNIVAEPVMLPDGFNRYKEAIRLSVNFTEELVTEMKMSVGTA